MVALETGQHDLVCADHASPNTPSTFFCVHLRRPALRTFNLVFVHAVLRLQPGCVEDPSRQRIATLTGGCNAAESKQALALGGGAIPFAGSARGTRPRGWPSQRRGCPRFRIQGRGKPGARRSRIAGAGEGKGARRCRMRRRAPFPLMSHPQKTASRASRCQKTAGGQDARPPLCCLCCTTEAAHRELESCRPGRRSSTPRKGEPVDSQSQEHK